MASLVEQLVYLNQKAEDRLTASLAAKLETTFQEIDQKLSDYRSTSENLIFQDFELATKTRVEGRLWDAHVKINQTYRKRLSRFRDEEGKKKVVEKRKLKKHYLDFIKSSQRFYRGYIQRLSSNYGGLPEIEAVAKKCNLDTFSADTQVQVSPQCRQLILLSCHQTLIRLGDLSRYRETELIHKDRNWAPAIGYYNLAGAINPASWMSHNQLAVIALADGNHMRALYHLYRALTVEEPHESAKGNLEIEFRKILNAQSKGELFRSIQDGKTPGNALIAWFMCLHARCYKGVEFTQHDELENEFLTNLTIDLRERSLEGTLQRLTLMNFAAQHLALSRYESDPDSRENMQSFFFFFRLNVKTFFILLQTLQPELERFAGDEVTGENSNSSSDRVTAVARRVLPGLRNYSSWLVVRSNLILLKNYGTLEDGALQVQVKEFWNSYAHTLTLLAATFDALNLPSVEYLLEEDEDTIGFMPLINEETKLRYSLTEPNIYLKPRWHDPGVERSHPNVEMLSRIRDFLLEGLNLCQDATAPIELVDWKDTQRFVFREDGVPSEILASPPSNGLSHHHHSVSSTSIDREDIQKARENGKRVDAMDAATSTSFSAGTELENMVDGLVDSEPQTTPNRRQYEFADPTDTSHPLYDGATRHTPQSIQRPFVVTDLVNQMMKTPSGSGQVAPRPVLPSIENSPFALQPGEASPHSRPATARRVSPQQGADTLHSFPMSASNSQTGFGRPIENQRPVDSTPISYRQQQMQVDWQQPHHHHHQLSSVNVTSSIPTVPLHLQFQQSSTVEPQHLPSSISTQFGPQQYNPVYQPWNGGLGGPNYGFPGVHGSYNGYLDSSPPSPEPKVSRPDFGAIGGPVKRMDPTPPSGQGG